MSRDWRCEFSFSNVEFPKEPELTAGVVEVLLLKRLEGEPEKLEDALWDLARFYGLTGHQAIARRYVERLVEVTPDEEIGASCRLALGQLAEQVGDFEAAIELYRDALSSEPQTGDTWYFINNNLGYSLIQRSHCAEAEPHLRVAIQIDPHRSNAHKNLGLALEGQGRNEDAVLAYVDAILADTYDQRAMNHLDELLRKGPALADDPRLGPVIRAHRVFVDHDRRMREKPGGG